MNITWEVADYGQPAVKHLDSGYTLVRWRYVLWAQYPTGASPTRDDCFNDESWALVQRWMKEAHAGT